MIDNRLTLKVFLFAALLCIKLPAIAQLQDARTDFSPGEIASLLKSAGSYSTADIVVLKELTTFYYYGRDNEKIVKKILVKVNTPKGGDALKHYRLPESFDPAFDGRQRRNGQVPSTLAPYVQEYKLRDFKAQRYLNGEWVNLSFSERYESYKRPGEFGPDLNDEQVRLDLPPLSPGDIVALYYESAFSSYGSDLFYFNGLYPKVECEYTYVYKVPLKFHDFEFTLPVNVPDSAITRSAKGDKDNLFVTQKVRLHGLDKITYPLNSFQGSRLPHIFADFSFYRYVLGIPGKESILFVLERTKNFQWMHLADTSDRHNRYNDRQSMALKKFLSSMPKSRNDSCAVFLGSLCDTLNNFRYISPRQLYWNEGNIQNTYSGEHLLKRRLAGNYLVPLYRDILKLQDIFYYAVNVQDRRFGEHNPKFRAHYAYEGSLLAVPVNNSYLFLMPRYNGVKYHLNEIPFYYEGGLAAFMGNNFQKNTSEREEKAFRMEKLPSSTFNDNVRSESGVIRVVGDSSKVYLTMKLNLSGQFSTLLRHLYLKEGVDSTVSWHYFRKCTDKPRSSGVNLKLTSATNEYPFRYGFACSLVIKTSSRDTLDQRLVFTPHNYSVLTGNSCS